MYKLCITMGFQGFLTTYLKEVVLLGDPHVMKWRFIFLKAALSVTKESVKSRFIFSNTLRKSGKLENSSVKNVQTLFRVLLRMKGMR